MKVNEAKKRFYFYESKSQIFPVPPLRLVRPFRQTRPAPSCGVSAQSGARRVKPCQSQSNHEMLPHASKWQKMAISGWGLGVRPGAIPFPPRSLLSTKASAAVDGKGGNRPQSCPIVHNRGVFLFKPSFIPSSCVFFTPPRIASHRKRRAAGMLLPPRFLFLCHSAPQGCNLSP
jgi:hypothetical protein